MTLKSEHGNVCCGIGLVFVCVCVGLRLYSTTVDWWPLVMSLIAGLSTALGGVLAVALREENTERYLASAFGVAASVMVLVSVKELILPALASLGIIASTVAFLMGCGIYKLVTLVYRYFEHEIQSLSGGTTTLSDDVVAKHHGATFRVGVLTAISLTLHNLPEGLAVMLSSKHSEERGITLAFAIALHNIPEGLAIAVPLYVSTQNATRSILWTVVSGLSEPLGALLCVLFFNNSLDETTLTFILCIVGGIMCAVSFVELIPQGLSHKHQRSAFYAGSAIGGTLVLFEMMLAPYLL